MHVSTHSTGSRSLALLSGLLLSLWLLVPSSIAAQPPGGGGRDDGLRRPQRPFSTRAKVFFCKISDVQCRTGKKGFNVDKIRDLYVFVVWRGVKGVHTQKLRFRLPDGYHYKTLETHFTTEATPSSLNVQVAQRSRGKPVVVGVLPVAGTFITHRSLLGKWTVEVFLDDEFVTKTRFTLRRRGRRR